MSNLADGGATMLRYWSSERTMWLEDVFGDPEPLDAPELTGRLSGTVGLAVSSRDQMHLERHRAEICTTLGADIQPAGMCRDGVYWGSAQFAGYVPTALGSAIRLADTTPI